MSTRMVDTLTQCLLILGCLHLGLTVLNVDMAAKVLTTDLVRKSAFGLLGVAALYQLLMWRQIRKRRKA